MNAVILAAGYGTRMVESAKGTEFESLCKEVPKPLLPVKGKPVIEHIAEKARGIGGKCTVVTNTTHLQLYEKWAGEYAEKGGEARIIDDGSTKNENRLGAIRDMLLGIEANGMNDTLIVGGDNLFSFDLEEFAGFSARKEASTMVLRELKDRRIAAKRYGVVEMDSDNRITGFEEKPEEPKTNLAATCIYFLKKRDAVLLREYVDSGGNSDAPGHFIKWLSERHGVYGWPFDNEKMFDIGNVETYAKAVGMLSGKPREA